MNYKINCKTCEHNGETPTTYAELVFNKINIITTKCSSANLETYHKNPDGHYSCSNWVNRFHEFYKKGFANGDCCKTCANDIKKDYCGANRLCTVNGLTECSNYFPK